VANKFYPSTELSRPQKHAQVLIMLKKIRAKGKAYVCCGLCKSDDCDVE